VKLSKIKNLLARLIKVFQKSKETIIISNKILQVPEMHLTIEGNTLQILILVEIFRQIKNIIIPAKNHFYQLIIQIKIQNNF
jgi:hypothetical protein